MTRLFAVGEFDETLIDAERFLAVQAVIAVDRAGQRMAPPAYARPTFEGSLITLEDGVTIPVPQSAREVGRRLAAAINRQSVMEE